MKRALLIVGILVSILAAHVVWGQSGAIEYETKINLHRNIPADREGMKAMIPEFRTVRHQLFFNSQESLFKPIIEDEEEQSFGGGGGRMMFRMPQVDIFLDHAKGVVLTKQEFMGKQYLIEDSVKVDNWKFGDQTKVIAGYECRMAYYTRTDTLRMGNREPVARTTEVTAWFTDKIRPFLGPERFHTLPGAVLAIDVNNGERVTVAKKVEVRDLKKNELKAPAGGTRITAREFRKTMEEQMQQMGGRGGMMFRN